MKTIGVLSGMSWESSAQSYALINWAYARALVCTELTRLIKPEQSALPLFDTTEFRRQAAVDLALSV